MGRLDTTLTISGKIMHANPNYLNPNMPTTANLISMVLFMQLPGNGFTLAETDDYGNTMYSLVNFIVTKFSWKPRKGEPLWDDFTMSFLENI